MYIGYHLFDLIFVFTLERRSSHQHLVCQHPYPPYIHWKIIFLFCQNLWRYILQSSTKSSSLPIHYSRPSKITQLRHSLSRKYYIFRFDIPVNDIFAVHLSNSLNHISEIFSCLSNGKGSCLILVLE